MMRKRIIWGVIIFVVVLVASQYLAIKMVYAKKLTGQPAYFLASTYNLKAGTVAFGEENKTLRLSDFFANQKFVLNFLKKQDQPLDQGQIDNMIWERLIKNFWLEYLAKEANINISDSDIDTYINQLNDLEDLQRTAREDFDISFVQYKEMVIRPVILEDRMYAFLLDNYNDQDGINKAQDAYEDLESGQDFKTVAQQYSDDMTYVDSSFYLAESELVDFYEPIKKLAAGQFSKIITLPGAYVIWKVESINQADGETVYEVKGIFIAAKTMDSFFEDFMANIQVDKIYK